MIIESPEIQIENLRKRIRAIENGLKDNILADHIVEKMNDRKSKFQNAIIILEKQISLNK